MIAKAKKLVRKQEEYFYKKGDTNEGIYCEAVPHWRSVKKFLYTIERIAPEVINDLYDIAPLYKKHCDATDENTMSEAPIEVKDAIYRWAKKYRLVDDGKKQWLYCEIAFRALKVYCNPEQYKSYFMELIKTKDGFALVSGEPHIRLARWASEPYIKYINTSAKIQDPMYPFVFAPHNGCLLGFFIDNKEEILRIPQMKECLQAINAIPGFEEKNLYRAETYEKNLPAKGLYWDARFEPWSSFEKKIDKLYSLYKAAYKKRTEEFCKKNGYEADKEKRNNKHFEWFVLYQVKGWELAKVADYIEANDGAVVGEDTIYKAVKGIAELVGLPLREGYTKSKQNIT